MTTDYSTDFRNFSTGNQVIYGPDDVLQYPPAATSMIFLWPGTRGMVLPPSSEKKLIHAHLESLGINEADLQNDVKIRLYNRIKSLSRELRITSFLIMGGNFLISKIFSTVHDWKGLQNLTTLRLSRYDVFNAGVNHLGKFISSSKVVNLALEGFRTKVELFLSLQKIRRLWIERCENMGDCEALALMTSIDLKQMYNFSYLCNDKSTRVTPGFRLIAMGVCISRASDAFVQRSQVVTDQYDGVLTLLNTMRRNF